MKNSNDIRKKLKDNYYLKWKPKNDIYGKKDISRDQLIAMYDEYTVKLEDFITEIDELSKDIRKRGYKPNIRQIGGYKRCVIDYPDKGWKEEYMQFLQAYKELMVDFLYYESEEYDDLSIDEINTMKEMANFLIKQAIINKASI